MKIKTKKTFNLPQLIEWVWDNDIKNKIFIADKQLTNIEFDDTGDFLIYGNGNRKNVKFTVGVEEEITENTVMPKLIERWKRVEDENEMCRYIEHENNSINKILFINPKRIVSTHFYAEIDGELRLIWRDGKMVE